MVELYENPDGLETAVVQVHAHRLFRHIGPLVLTGTDQADLASLLSRSEELVGVDNALAAADSVADMVATQDPDHLAGQNPYQWVAMQLGWWSYAVREEVREGLTHLDESAVHFVAVAGSVVTILVSLGLEGLPASLVGSYLGLLSACWRGRSRGQ